MYPGRGRGILDQLGTFDGDGTNAAAGKTQDPGRRKASYA
ncbi:hypothetical protein A1F94_000651 [Pyrenophora tritici-repentis]|nr:hypothetical protein A1F99_012700 [Pyrenophora tritici-repentis]KAG9387759.1 hypothetical protein A1F94_000651 [Pyrenophora tritici-repentis]